MQKCLPCPHTTSTRTPSCSSSACTACKGARMAPAVRGTGVPCVPVVHRAFPRHPGHEHGACMQAGRHVQAPAIGPDGLRSTGNRRPGQLMHHHMDLLTLNACPKQNCLARAEPHSLLQRSAQRWPRRTHCPSGAWPAAPPRCCTVSCQSQGVHLGAWEAMQRHGGLTAGYTGMALPHLPLPSVPTARSSNVWPPGRGSSTSSCAIGLLSGLSGH